MSLMFFVFALATVFFIILCINQIAHTLELCKVLHLIHVCPRGSSDHDRGGAEMEEQDITSFFMRMYKSLVQKITINGKLRQKIVGKRKLCFFFFNSIFHIFCTRHYLNGDQIGFPIYYIYCIPLYSLKIPHMGDTESLDRCGQLHRITWYFIFIFIFITAL